MATHSKLISSEVAAELLRKGEAVKSGSPEHLKMMAALWEKVAKKYVFVVIAGKWFYRDGGADRVPVQEVAAQKAIDRHFRSDKPVLTYGRSDGRVKATYEAPQLAQVTNAHYEKDLGKHRSEKAKGEHPFEALVVDFMDTYPSEDPVVVTKDGNRVWNLWGHPGVWPIKPEKYVEPRWFLGVVERFFGEQHQEREYFLDWCAHLICHPEIKMPVSVWSRTVGPSSTRP